MGDKLGANEGTEEIGLLDGEVDGSCEGLGVTGASLGETVGTELVGATLGAVDDMQHITPSPKRR